MLAANAAWGQRLAATDLASRLDRLILALNEPARKGARGDVPKADIGVRRAEEGDARTDEDRNAGENEPMDQASPEEALDRDAAVHIGVPDPGGLELPNNVFGITGDMANDGAGRGRSERAGTQDMARLRPVGPGAKAEDGLIGMAPEQQGIGGREEGFVAVVLCVMWEPIDRAVAPRNEPIDADANKDRGLHAGALCPLTTRVSCAPRFVHASERAATNRWPGGRLHAVVRLRVAHARTGEMNVSPVLVVYTVVLTVENEGAAELGGELE